MVLNVYETRFNVENQLSVYQQMLLNKPCCHIPIIGRMAELRTEYLVFSHWSSSYSPSYSPSMKDLERIDSYILSKKPETEQLMALQFQDAGNKLEGKYQYYPYAQLNEYDRLNTINKLATNETMQSLPSPVHFLDPREHYPGLFPQPIYVIHNTDIVRYYEVGSGPAKGIKYVSHTDPLQLETEAP